MRRCLPLLFLSLTACTSSLGHLARLELVHPEPFAAGDNPGPPVQGEDCAAILLGTQLGSPSVEMAIAHALHNTGTNELRDVQLSQIDRGTWFAGERCVHVTGRLP